MCCRLLFENPLLIWITNNSCRTNKQQNAVDHPWTEFPCAWVHRQREHRRTEGLTRVLSFNRTPFIIELFFLIVLVENLRFGELARERVAIVLSRCSPGRWIPRLFLDHTHCWRHHSPFGRYTSIHVWNSMIWCLVAIYLIIRNLFYVWIDIAFY